jgi:hypothetical protein
MRSLFVSIRFDLYRKVSDQMNTALTYAKLLFTRPAAMAGLVEHLTARLGFKSSSCQTQNNVE